MCLHILVLCSGEHKQPGVMNIHTMLEAYKRLLVDVSVLSGVPLGAPDEITYEWVLIEAPSLEKQVLAYIEGTRLEQPGFPEWLLPLWSAFLVKHEARILRWVRILLLFCYKAEHEPTNEQIQEAQASFESTDLGCGTWDDACKSATFNYHFLRSARQTVARVIGSVDWQDIDPSHGPGGVFPSCKPDAKSRFLTYYPSIQRWYPYDKWLWSLPSFWEDIMVHNNKGAVKEETDITAKLVAVPKDSRGPRIICVHPKEAIWIQQGQRSLLEAAINRSPLTRGKINFADQTVNGKIALASSLSREFVTLDLKEASDRISVGLVESLFGTYVTDILSCSRANKVQLFDGRVIVLKKWAPMGNALCFPVQSLVFWSLVHAGIVSRYGISCNDIYVFGDDILFPSIYYDGVLNALIRSGLVPNPAKTFRRGFFRESCGVDAYRGIDVTPHRMKKTDVITPQDALAFLDLAKRLRLDGFEHCASYLYVCVSKRFGTLPLCNNSEAQGLVEYVDRDLGWLMLNEPRLLFSKRFHKYRIPCRMVVSVLKDIVNDDWYHLHDSLIRISHMRGEISDRRTEYPIPYRTRLTYGWADCRERQLS